MDNISIHGYILKSNLPEWLNSKASTGITSAIDNYIKSGRDTNIIKNEESPKVLEGRVEKWEHINNNILKENNTSIDYLIAQNSKGDNYFHKAAAPNLIAGPKPDGQGLPSNIINHFLPKNNLPEWLNSKASTGITSAIDNYIKSGSDTNIIKNEESPKILEGRVEKWEHINNIILKKNNIPINPNTINHLKKPDWTGYKNPLTGDNRIYTAEDIGNMTTKEFGQREKEIDAQIKKMGIPRKKDLSVFGGGTIYIAPYTRADGVQVKCHYRAMR